MKKKNSDNADDLIKRYLPLSEEALEIAEGWTLLPERTQRHVKLLIDDYIAQEIPAVRQIYENVSAPAQQRINKRIEEIQSNFRGEGPKSNE